jgi:hypothetical protein
MLLSNTNEQLGQDELKEKLQPLPPLPAGGEQLLHSERVVCSHSWETSRERVGNRAPWLVEQDDGTGGRVA